MDGEPRFSKMGIPKLPQMDGEPRLSEIGILKLPQMDIPSLQMDERSIYYSLSPPLSGLHYKGL